MKPGWEQYEQAAEAGPVQLLWRIFWLILGIIVVTSVTGYAFGWFGEAATVAKEEFGPKALLQKYEWFKDASAELDKKQADIKVYEGRIAAMKDTYKDLPRQNWPREDREQYNVWGSEVAGAKASFNGLAAEYNAQMAKFNWRFANKGDLPEGADKTLPREYPTYIEQ